MSEEHKNLFQFLSQTAAELYRLHSHQQLYQFAVVWRRFTSPAHSHAHWRMRQQRFSLSLPLISSTQGGSELKAFQSWVICLVDDDSIHPPSPSLSSPALSSQPPCLGSRLGNKAPHTLSKLSPSLSPSLSFIGTPLVPWHHKGRY